LEVINIIDRWYRSEQALRALLLQHSQQVCARALKIADAHPELAIDLNFLEEAAMLHDIGIIQCDAPGIHCHGTHPYICHGILGGQMLRELDMPRHARVCERHTGAGLTRHDIEAQQLPLPAQDFLPETIEEQIICYADKFYSKSKPDREKTYEQALRSLTRFGNDGAARFVAWHQRFEP